MAATFDTSASLYDHDFYAWTQEQARLLRNGRLSALDLENLAEEIESMGRSERRELISRLAVLLAHLLKWRYQPSHRGRSWQLTIQEQRHQAARVLGDNPSLKAQIDAILSAAYGDAIIRAARETGLDVAAFPAGCPLTLEQILDAGYWPD